MTAAPYVPGRFVPDNFDPISFGIPPVPRRSRFSRRFPINAAPLSARILIALETFIGVRRGFRMRCRPGSIHSAGLPRALVLAHRRACGPPRSGPPPCSGYQAALGAPWVDLLGLKVYAPWKLFVWWLAFDAQAPDVFARAGAVAAFGGLASGAVAIGGAAWRASLKQASHNLWLGPLGGPSDVRTARLQGEQRRRARPLSAAAICATTAPSMSSRWRRRGRARASAWCCRRC